MRPLPMAEKGSIKEEPQHSDRQGCLQPEVGADVAIGDCDFPPLTPLKRSRALPPNPRFGGKYSFNITSPAV